MPVCLKIPELPDLDLLVCSRKTRMATEAQAVGKETKDFTLSRSPILTSSLGFTTSSST